MRSVTVVILHLFLAQAHDTSGDEGSMDKVADKVVSKLFDRVLNAMPLHAEVDDTTLGKPAGQQVMTRSSLQSLAHSLPISGASASRQFRSLSTSAMQDKMCGFGSRPLCKLAISAIAANNRRNQVRGVSVKATEDEVKEEVSNMDPETKEKVEEVAKEVKLKAEDMAGVSGPLGFWDPVGFSTDCSEGKLLFYREVELKHGRVGMLASVGFLVGEQFHPLFGGNIDVPSYVAFQQTPLQTFWPAVVAAIAIPEVFSVFTFNPPEAALSPGKGPWTLKTGRVPGDFNFDPLGIKPQDPKEFKEMQTKELNNGRIAMLAAAGMIAQELATGQKLF
jgi:hypothetical protein